MNIPDVCCSLELAKQLHELGIKQESLFYWCKGIVNPYLEYHENGCVHQDYPDPIYICSAFTSSELGEMFPIYLFGYANLHIEKFDGKWKAEYYDSRTSSDAFYSENMADVMAKMLIYLIDKKLIKVPK